MKRLVLFALVSLSTTAGAQSILLGKKLIGKGDSASRALEAAGEPGKLDRIAGDESSPAMEIWTYDRGESVVTLWMVGGKIVKAAEERRASATSATGSDTHAR
jgi:hypothetical protein